MTAPPSKKVTFNPRNLMERAIDVMRQSVHEPRADGKATPSVGALLWKPNGTVETAHRGELRDGDHAEFTLLERKNRANPLDNCVLFATLEPCAKEARKPPKTCCSERIVQSRIRRVWVGVQDPDPKVAGKGIQRLQEAGVDVQMFDHDLQDIILAENERFFAEALDRAKEAAEAKPDSIELSVLERPIASSDSTDLDVELLESYRAAVGIDAAVGSDEFWRLLSLSGSVVRVGDTWKPTGYGMVLFGKAPRLAVPEAGLHAELRYADGKVETKEFDEAILRLPDRVIEWLRGKLPNVVDRTRVRRESRPDIPEILLREAIVNALLHRDYNLSGTICHLIVDPDTMTIRSPGVPPPPITMEQLQSFTAPRRSRNPRLHVVLSKMGLAEERNWGMKSMKEGFQKLGLPLPRYSRTNEPYLDLIFFRSLESSVQTLPDSTLAKLNKEERRGWEFLATRTAVTRAEYEKELDIDARTAQRHLKEFVDLGLVERVGAGRSTMFKMRSR